VWSVALLQQMLYKTQMLKALKRVYKILELTRFEKLSVVELWFS
jgi:hypothetical protein